MQQILNFQGKKRTQSCLFLYPHGSAKYYTHYQYLLIGLMDEWLREGRNQSINQLMNVFSHS